MKTLFKKLFGQKNSLAPILKRNPIILDVRSQEEYSRGHARGSVNIPLDVLNSKMSDLKKKNMPIVTCCASGRRSGLAAKKMRTLGIEAYNGGSWRKVERYL